MKFSTKIRYGIRAMVEIAMDKDQNGVFQKDIAERQSISVKYLDQIISALKASGLIVNVKGRKSGYILAKKPSDITILEIHNAFEAGITIIECLNTAIHCDLEEFCKTYKFWGNLNAIIHNYFNSVTLLDLINGNIPTEIKVAMA